MKRIVAGRGVVRGGQGGAGAGRDRDLETRHLIEQRRRMSRRLPNTALVMRGLEVAGEAEATVLREESSAVLGLEDLPKRSWQSGGMCFTIPTRRRKTWTEAEVEAVVELEAGAERVSGPLSASQTRGRALASLPSRERTVGGNGGRNCLVRRTVTETMRLRSLPSSRVPNPLLSWNRHKSQDCPTTPALWVSQSVSLFLSTLESRLQSRPSRTRRSVY